MQLRQLSSICLSYSFGPTLNSISKKVDGIILSTKMRSRCVTLPWQQNFWMTTNRKLYLKSESIRTVSNFIVFIPFHLICQILATLFQVLNPKGQDLSLQKGKENVYVVLGSLISCRSRARQENGYTVKILRYNRRLCIQEKGRSNYHLKTVRVENMFSTKKVFLKPSNVRGVDKYHDLF